MNISMNRPLTGVVLQIHWGTMCIWTLPRDAFFGCVHLNWFYVRILYGIFRTLLVAHNASTCALSALSLIWTIRRKYHIEHDFSSVLLCLTAKYDEFLNVNSWLIFHKFRIEHTFYCIVSHVPRFDESSIPQLMKTCNKIKFHFLYVLFGHSVCNYVCLHCSHLMSASFLTSLKKLWKLLIWFQQMEHTHFGNKYDSWT